jgi:tRNA-dihydrouridine synthase 1
VFTSAPEDRPLIAQICGNDPSVIVECANLMLKQYPVDAIDLNLGCPQRIAQRGFYGAFLMDDLQLVERIVKSMVREIPVPITCKIRVFEDREKTVEYAKMLQECGIQMIVVHGRTRKLVKGYFDPADLQIIKRIKQELRIPVFANGNVEFHEDLEKVIQESNADGVMAAEGLLSNPKLFSLDNHDFKTPGDACDLALEYLDLAVQYPTTIGIIRGHCLRIMYKL